MKMSALSKDQCALCCAVEWRAMKLMLTVMGVGYENLDDMC